MALFARIITTLISLRALYAASLVLYGYTVRLGAEWAPLMTGDLIPVIQGMPVMIAALWTVYVAGYLAAAILLLRRDARALPVYIGAFALDLLAWTYMGTVLEYALANDGLSATLDHAFNLLDIGCIGALYLLQRGDWLRPPAARLGSAPR